MTGIGNLLWLVCGGLLMAIGWWLEGVFMFVTIVGIPWSRACFVIGSLAFMPFGREAIGRKELTGQDDIGTGALGLIGNIVWFLFGGFPLAMGHAFAALACAVTVIGIPFAIQHLKLASLAIAPIGKTIVLKQVAAVVRTVDAEDAVRRYRGR